MLNISTKHIDLFPADGTVMQCYVAMPNNDGKQYPGLILFQEAFGVNEHVRHLAQRFAKEGYVVIAPELFHRTADKGFEDNVYDFGSVMQHYQAVTETTVIADAQACYDWLTEQANVTKDNLACCGHCMGGKASYIANSFLPLRAAISFYGGGIDKILHLSEQQQSPILFMFGGQDKSITKQAVAAIINSMDEAAKPYNEVVFSTAGHAFFCEARPTNYQKAAANQAWVLSLAFLKEQLL